MTDSDPELQEILRKKANSIKSEISKEASFFSEINKDGVTDITDSNIDRLIQTSPLPVLVDFSADAWCRPCQVMKPVYEELSREYANKVVFLKINTDHNPQSPGKYRIFSVPTFIMFKSGKPIAQRTGASPKVKFKSWIDEVLQQSS